MEGNYSGTAWANVFWLMTVAAGLPAAGDVNQLANVMYQNYSNAFMSHLDAACTFERCRVTYFPDGADTVIFGEHTASTPGGVATTALMPASSSVVVSWFASVYWRGGKPRTYLPGIPHAYQSGVNKITQASADALNAAASQFRSTVNSSTAGVFNTVTLGLVSFVSQKADRPTPLFFPIETNAVHTRLDTQRRRLGAEVV